MTPRNPRRKSESFHRRMRLSTLSSRARSPRWAKLSPRRSRSYRRTSIILAGVTYGACSRRDAPSASSAGKICIACCVGVPWRSPTWSRNSSRPNSCAPPSPLAASLVHFSVPGLPARVLCSLYALRVTRTPQALPTSLLVEWDRLPKPWFPPQKRPAPKSVTAWKSLKFG